MMSFTRAHLLSTNKLAKLNNMPCPMPERIDHLRSLTELALRYAISGESDMYAYKVFLCMEVGRQHCQEQVDKSRHEERFCCQGLKGRKAWSCASPCSKCFVEVHPHGYGSRPSRTDPTSYTSGFPSRVPMIPTITCSGTWQHPLPKPLFCFVLVFGSGV